MSRPSPWGRARDALIGVVYVALLAGLVGGAWLAYQRVFVDRTDITLTTGTVGNALQKGSDVKLHGVPVGTVTDIEPTATGARLTLALEPDVLAQLPVGTTARLLPKTLFGERYVSLLRPTDATGTTGAAGATLEGGDTIRQDASAASVELEQVFDELLPVLQAIQPDKLSATLGELAQLLRGNGDRLGTTLVRWGEYLQKLNPLTPQLADDLAALGRVADAYTVAAPDLIDALDSFTTTSRTLVQERGNVERLFASVVVAADDTDAWLRRSSSTIIQLSDRSRAALEAVEPYAREFPCTFAALRDFVPVMDKVLGKGTDEPGIHVVLDVTADRGRYVVGRDDPAFDATTGPRCPYQDGSVRAVGAGGAGGAGDPGDATGDAQPAATRSGSEPPRIAPPPSERTQRIFDRSLGLGEANSPAENRLIAELMAPEAGVPVGDYPQWGSLLLGPVLRGAQVELR